MIIFKPTLQKLLWFFFYILVFSLALNHSNKGLDPDYGWHQRFGQQIFETKQAPQEQIYMWTLPHQTWVDHEWLSNLLLYLGQEHLGYFALNIIFALIITFTLILSTWYLKKYYLAKSGSYALWLWQILGLIAMMPHLGVRIQEISIFFIAILLLIIDAWYQQRVNKYFIYLVVPLLCLWANLHAGFLLGLAVLGWWLTVQLILVIIKRLTKQAQPWGNKYNIEQLKHFSLALFLGSLATLINPYGWRLYNFLFGYTNNAYLTIINEWLPSYYLPLQYWQLLFTAIVASLIIINFPWKKITQEQNLWRLSLIIIFMILANKSLRHFPLFFVVALLNLAPLALNNPVPPMVKTIANLKWLQTMIIIILASLITLALIFTKFPQSAQTAFCQNYPCQTVDFLKQHPNYLSFKTFNYYNYGGFFIWTLPEMRLFIDGRLPQYEFNNHSILEEYSDFFTTEDSLQKKLQEHDIEMIVWTSQKKGRRANWLDKLLFDLKDLPPKNIVVDQLNNNPNWQLIFKGPVGIVYLRADLVDQTDLVNPTTTRESVSP